MSRYNLIAGQSVARLAALSDGIFAVAMTILVLDLRAPLPESIHGEDGLWRGIVLLGPKLLMYFMSFLTLSIFWVGQQTQLNHIDRSDRGLTWIHLLFLFAVSILPFSTNLLAAFIGYRLALIGYWLNILLLGVTLYFSWECALAKGLIKSDIPAGLSIGIRHRILTAQGLYGFGALLCVFDTYWSIGLMVTVQLYYALAPQAWFRRRSTNG